MKWNEMPTETRLLVDIHQMARPYAADHVLWFSLDYDALHSLTY